MSKDKGQSGQESLGQSVASGAAWLTSGNIFSRLLGFICIIVLALFLVPENFGLIAMAVSIYALLDALSGLGFQGYLIQHKEADGRQYDTVWTLTILRGFLIAGVLVLLARPAASFWVDARIEGLVYLYALSAVVFWFHQCRGR
jgi:lipopolysaccharide exporter